MDILVGICRGPVIPPNKVFGFVSSELFTLYHGKSPFFTIMWVIFLVFSNHLKQIKGIESSRINFVQDFMDFLHLIQRFCTIHKDTK